MHIQLELSQLVENGVLIKDLFQILNDKDVIFTLAYDGSIFQAGVDKVCRTPKVLLDGPGETEGFRILADVFSSSTLVAPKKSKHKTF